MHCVAAVVIRRRGNAYEILTQWRTVKDKTYDPLYDQTWEVMGETLGKGENIIDGLRRCLQEECGLLNDEIACIYGAEDLYLSDRGEIIMAAQPLCFLQSLGKPQLWNGPVFMVQTPATFEPTNEGSEGEVGHFKWWKPDELLNTLRTEPGKFMRYHYRPLELTARRLL